MSTPHNDQALGKALGSKKKRSAVFIVIIASIAVHVLALGGLAAIKIIEVLQPEPEFEAPPVVENKPPPPPPPPPPTNKRAQRSLPRPQPLAARNPQNMSVPAIEINNSDLAIGGGRGFGGGLGSLGGAVADSLRISFFGMESTGGNVVILFDCSMSGKEVFKKTRSELIKTIDQMADSSSAQLAVIYFGGRDGNQLGLPNKGKKIKDPTRDDFWLPTGVSRGKWLASSGMGKVQKQLEAVDTTKLSTGKGPEHKYNGFKFRLGTNYWGALNAAYKMKPAPDTIYFMVEPRVAFPSEDTVRKSYEVFKKYGLPKPENTTINFVVGKKVGNKKPMELMLNLLHGGELSKNEIRERIVF